MKALEILPLVAFFLSYKLWGLIQATTVLVLTTIAAMAFTILIKKQRPNNITIFSTIILVAMGTITVLTEDVQFIQMKPTFFYTICAVVLLVGLLYKKYLIKALLDPVIDLSDQRWRTISWQWIIFLIGSACGNEIIRRIATEDDWVTFKVVMMPIATVIVIISQLVIYKKYLRRQK